MRVKSYLYIVFGGILLFLLFHFVAWETCTKQIFDNKKGYVGELGRLSYMNTMFHPRKSTFTLSQKHISYEFSKNDIDIRKIDLLTIGDSFSNGAAEGKNPFYQDYLAEKYNIKVLNIHPVYGKSALDTLVMLHNSTLLQSWKPKVIILESVERRAIDRFSRVVNFSQNMALKELKKQVSVKHSTLPVPSYINTLNYNSVLYKILYHFDDNAFFSKAYYSELKASLFSGTGNGLLFYEKDIENISFSTEQSVDRLNKNLNTLSALLKQNGISLYFMPAVDKYNLYSEYIPDNPYPESVFFELLRPLSKTYQLIDTKALLKPLLDHKEKDIYYSDDSHWSYKASKYIVEQTQFPEFE